MPQLAPVVLKDYSAADHTFAPKGISGAVATLAQGNGVPIADKELTVSQTKTTTGRTKVLVKLKLPVVQDMTVNGVTRPTVVRTAYAELTLTFDNTSSVIERGDMRAYLQSLMGSTFGQYMIDDLSVLY